MDEGNATSSVMEMEIDNSSASGSGTTTDESTSMRISNDCGRFNVVEGGNTYSSSSLSLLENKLDRYAMDIVLSYLTLVEYSNLSIASGIMRDVVSKSSHLHMDGYGLFRQQYRRRRRREESDSLTEKPFVVITHRGGVQELVASSSSLPEPEPPESSTTPQQELQQLMDRFKNLNVLNLQGLAAVGDDLIDILNRCPSALTLKSITLHSCALSYWCAHSFQLENLQSLTLTGNSIRARMTFLLEHSKNLKSLTFKQCPALRDGDIAGISRVLHTSLEELVLNHTKVSKPVASFPRLTRASFAGGFCLIDLSGFDCPNLKILNLSFCVRLSGTHIEKIVEASPALETLIIVKCSGVQTLDLESKNLRRLDAGFTHNLRDLRLVCPALQHLDVSEIQWFNLQYAHSLPLLIPTTIVCTVRATAIPTNEKITYEAK